MSATMRIDVRDEKATRFLAELDDDLELAVKDIAKDMAIEFKKQASNQLFRNGSVVTGTGLKSMDVIELTNGAEVRGRKYLLALDSGTAPHTPRVSQRLRTWAAQEGWTVQSIVNHIKKEGTDPHPFLRVSATRTLTKADEIADMNIQERIHS